MKLVKLIDVKPRNKHDIPTYTFWYYIFCGYIVPTYIISSNFYYSLNEAFEIIFIVGIIVYIGTSLIEWDKLARNYEVALTSNSYTIRHYILYPFYITGGMLINLLRRLL